jgi:hypothetical protein
MDRGAHIVSDVADDQEISQIRILSPIFSVDRGGAVNDYQQGT